MGRISLNRKRRLTGYIYLFPALLLVGLAVGYPIAHIFVMAFSQVNSFGTIIGYNGFKNFVGLWQSGFTTVIKNTIIWTLSALVVTIVISLILAYYLSSTSIRGQSFFRTMVIIPWAIPLTIVAVLSSMMLNSTYGQLNTLLLNIHILKAPIGWLATAKTSFPMMIVIAVWVSIPFTTLTLLGGMQAIPHDVYEASALDGATGFSTFFRVTLPLLTSSLQLVVLINLAYLFNSFPIIWVLTQGGPDNTTATATTYVYQLAFTDGQFGIAGAAALLAFCVLISVSLVYMWIYRKSEGTML